MFFDSMRYWPINKFQLKKIIYSNDQINNNPNKWGLIG